MDDDVRREEKEKAWEIVDRGTNRGRGSRYIDVKFKSLEQAVHARADLLLPFPRNSDWRKRLCIRRPDGTFYNPDFDEIKG